LHQAYDPNNATGSGVIETGEGMFQDMMERRRKKRESMSEQAYQIMQKKGQMLKSLAT
jgi:hypothetical protein